ncbi:MAG: DUF3800 domain-containing protein [Methyloligella sp. ZOD6]
MSRLYVFTDEAGCFTFNRNHNVSRYFILCTVVMPNCAVGTELIDLRRRLAWDGYELGEYFHATTDRQAVRDEVFQAITKHDFTIQATIMEKSKAQPQVRRSKPRFYQYGYFYLFKHGTTSELPRDCEALVTTACLGNRKERAAFQDAVDDVMRQTQRAREWKADFMPCHADPCLQVADYCAWAIQRKYERPKKNQASYELIKDRITYEYDLWKHGNVHYY